MRARQRATTTLGLLSVLASLSLLSPGVRAQPAEPAGRCGSAATHSDVDLEAFVERLRRENAGPAVAEDDVVALNNRGFNYGPPPQVEFDEILTETRGSR